MELNIRLAQKTDLAKYTELLQKIYQDTYVNESIGLTEECFSKEIFNTEDTQKYLASNLEINKNQKCWLAFFDSKLVGSITITKKDNECEMKGFYVDKNFQGQGIGKKLWQKVLKFAKNLNIICDIFAHNIKTLEIYKKWGFKIDKEKGGFCRHWPEWPEGVKAKCIYMRFINSRDL